MDNAPRAPPAPPRVEPPNPLGPSTQGHTSPENAAPTSRQVPGPIRPDRAQRLRAMELGLIPNRASNLAPDGTYRGLSWAYDKEIRGARASADLPIIRQERQPWSSGSRTNDAASSVDRPPQAPSVRSAESSVVPQQTAARYWFGNPIHTVNHLPPAPARSVEASGGPKRPVAWDWLELPIRTVSHHSPPSPVWSESSGLEYEVPRAQQYSSVPVVANPVRIVNDPSAAPVSGPATASAEHESGATHNQRGNPAQSVNNGSPAPLSDNDLSRRAEDASVLLELFAKSSPRTDPEYRSMMDSVLENVVDIHRQLRITSPRAGDEAEVEDTKVESGCIVCYSRIADTVLMPCKHLVLCDVSVRWDGSGWGVLTGAGVL